ncbi:mechanosensitive ion channel protein MscS [Sphingobacteriaceae bacterium]|nr:mechanosensitive ion channel protein MscS [Sphingobacteriaceae bacterium]
MSDFKFLVTLERFLNNFHFSWNAFLSHVPEILGGILCFTLTLFLANFLSKLASTYAVRRSKDILIANFVGKIIWTVIFIFGTVLALGILGLGNVSNKILAGAGITTFVVGFALKDIGENFLSGIILAFSRPYHVGNLIECTGVKGIVKDMTMRQTTVEAENGKIIMIPNSAILKNPLTRYLNDDNNLRQEFSISIESSKLQEAVILIKKTVSNFQYVMNEERPVKVVVDSISGDKIKMLVIYWFSAKAFHGSRSGSKSEIMMAVIMKLNEAEVKFSG